VFLLSLLARTVLPPPCRLSGWYAWVVGLTILGMSVFALYAGVQDIFGN
jgi:hypothetical protein